MKTKEHIIQVIKQYKQPLIEHQVYYIGTYCNLKTMQEKEVLRQDRYIGLSNDQYSKVHHQIADSYDLTIDTTHLSSFTAATKILSFVQSQ